MDWNCWLEESNNVVADIADRAARKMRNVRRRDELKTLERLLKFCQRIALAVRAVENNERIESDKGKATELFIALGRFEKKAWLAVVDLRERRDRRFHVGHKIDNQRYEIAAFRELAELVARGRNIEGRHGAG